MRAIDALQIERNRRLDEMNGSAKGMEAVSILA